MEINGQLMELNYVDTAGSEDWDRIRPINWYTDPDVFLFCYSVNSSGSVQSFKRHWMIKIQQSPAKPPYQIMLVGCKSDLKGSTEESKIVSSEEVSAIAQELGAVAIMECSALTGTSTLSLRNRLN
jgi:small GTP-binding protein